MSSIGYVPLADNDKAIWIGNFSSKLATHAATLGIAAAEVTSVQKDAAMCFYVITMQESYKQTLRNIIGYKRLLLKASGQQHLTAIPVPPTLAAAPAAVPEGIFDRISKLVARIKASPNYTESIGLDLGVIAP
jgi:hypothetical protein